MVSRFSARTPKDAAEGLLSGARSEPVYAINQPLLATRAVVRAIYDDEELPAVRLVSEREPLEALADRFPLASTAAASLADGRLSVRVREDLPIAPVFVTDEGVRTLMAMGDVAAYGDRQSGAYVDRARELAPKLWDRAEPFTVATPSLDRLLDTLGSVDDELRESFAEAVAVATREQLPFDPVGTALVLACEQELRYRDVSDWSVETGLASRATVSRRKRTLEDAGFLDTRTGESDGGRPPQRLVFTDRGVRRYSWADTDELVERVVETLDRH